MSKSWISGSSDKSSSGSSDNKLDLGADSSAVRNVVPEFFKNASDTLTAKQRFGLVYKNTDPVVRDALQEQFGEFTDYVTRTEMMVFTLEDDKGKKTEIHVDEALASEKDRINNFHKGSQYMEPKV